jgi:hypothetical protein
MPQDAIKKQTLSARGLSDKEFTKHCRGFEGQIKVTLHFGSFVKKSIFVRGKKNYFK